MYNTDHEPSYSHRTNVGETVGGHIITRLGGGTLREMPRMLCGHFLRGWAN